MFWVYNETKKVVNCLDYRLVCIQRCGLGDGDPEFVFADAAVGVAGGHLEIRDSWGGLGDCEPDSLLADGGIRERRWGKSDLSWRVFSFVSGQGLKSKSSGTAFFLSLFLTFLLSEN